MHLQGEFSPFRGETHKAEAGRRAEGFYDLYVRLPGLDIGCGIDPVHPDFDRWDIRFGHADATVLDGVPDGRYATVYSSHLLEHLVDPVAALREWWRVLGRNGHLIVAVPHRDLYERRLTLPSVWNSDHKSFWLPEEGDGPDTRGLLPTLLEAAPEAVVLRLAVRDQGWHPVAENEHPPGEYSIEIIATKP